VTAADLAAVVVSVLSLAAVAVLTWFAVVLARTVAELRDTVASVRAEAVGLVEEARAAVARADGEIERVDEILDAAEAISSRVDGASRVAYLALSKPVIKTAAVATGAQRAARRFRGNG
jgi:hypothetical protein